MDPAPDATVPGGGPANLMKYLEHYNTMRLYSAIGHITPKDKLARRAEQILATRDAKLEAARQARRTAAMAQSD